MGFCTTTRRVPGRTRADNYRRIYWLGQSESATTSRVTITAASTYYLCQCPALEMRVKRLLLAPVELLATLYFVNCGWLYVLVRRGYLDAWYLRSFFEHTVTCRQAGRPGGSSG